MSRNSAQSRSARSARKMRLSPSSAALLASDWYGQRRAGLMRLRALTRSGRSKA